MKELKRMYPNITCPIENEKLYRMFNIHGGGKTGVSGDLEGNPFHVTHKNFILIIIFDLFFRRIFVEHSFQFSIKILLNNPHLHIGVDRQMADFMKLGINSVTLSFGPFFK